ncbi:MAG: YiiX/YebB-like N1pC/P60 family cysteine hydrolase [Ghiorsea sp.]
MEKENTQPMTFLSRLSWRIESWVNSWLLYEKERTTLPLQDFKVMREKLYPADVLLFKGRARISSAISFITQSHWTHAALYIGRCSDYNKDSETVALIQEHFDGDDDTQLVVESLLGLGTVITPLSEYANDSIRLCRPRGILKDDVELVVQHVVGQVGREYDIRQLFDLARFVFPYALLPRRWFSSLFYYKPGKATRAVCSTVIVEAFMHVNFPVIPVIRQKDENVSVHKRNPRLFTPQDFDYSPYFQIIKFPYLNYDRSFLGVSTKGGYRELPWDKGNVYCNDEDECHPIEEKPKQDDKNEAQSV